MNELLKNIQTNPDLDFLKHLKKQARAGIYLVGGAVRDSLLGRESKDFDFLVTGVGKEELEKGLAHHGIVKDVESRAFGVLKFVPNTVPEESRSMYEPIEIALPRTEIQKGKGYKDFEVHYDPELPVEADLSRRDFTINAIALNIKTGELVDPFGGVSDIKAKTIRAVGVAKDRFAEDPSRMLRALRFASQFGFEIAAETWSAISGSIGEVNKKYKDQDKKLKERVAREVIAKEFLKGFDADPIRTLDLYEESGALAELFPELVEMRECEQPKNFHSEGDVLEHSKLALKNLLGLPAVVKKHAGLLIEFITPDAELKLAVLLHDAGKPPAKVWREDYGRHVFYGHDTMGAEIASKLIDRLKLTSYPSGHPLHIDKDKVHWLIKNHLFALNTDVNKVSLNALKKRFFREDDWGEYLKALTWADATASITDQGKPVLDKILDLTKKLSELKIQFGETEKPPPVLIKGDEIMKLLGIKPGQPVGLALEVVSELQLENPDVTKEEARSKLMSVAGEIKKMDRAAVSKKLGIREL